MSEPTSLRAYARAVEVAALPSRDAWMQLESVTDRIEHLQLEIDQLQDRADDLARHIEDDDSGAFALLVVAECAGLHKACAELLTRSCNAARQHGHTDAELAQVLKVNRSTISRRYPK